MIGTTSQQADIIRLQSQVQVLPTGWRGAIVSGS